MGWYVTCEICGKEGKYNPDCDCYERESRENAQKLQGRFVIKSFIRYDSLYQMLTNCTGSTIYMVVNLAGGGYPVYRVIREINEKEFNEAENLSDEDKSDESSSEGEEEKPPTEGRARRAMDTEKVDEQAKNISKEGQDKPNERRAVVVTLTKEYNADKMQEKLELFGPVTECYSSGNELTAVYEDYRDARDAFGCLEDEFEVRLVSSS